MHASFQLFILITPLPSQASTCQALCPTSQSVPWWTRRGWVWPMPWSSLAVLTTSRAQGQETLTPMPTAHKEQNSPAPLGLLSGARQTPEALAKGGSKSPSASTAHPSPQQLELKAPVLGELLESTSHLLKANTAGL